jgi:vacuolar-type H+-ATPase subunit H
MAKETIQAVRQAELNAANKEKAAIQKKEVILAEAQQEAGIIITTRIKQAKEEAERNLVYANEQGANLMETIKQRAENEVIAMKEIAKRKEEEAIKLVLSSVI